MNGMFAIYVRKSWLRTIGEIADRIIVREESAEYVSLLAADAITNFPFAETKLARKQATDKGDSFLGSQIPASEISGIFNLTAAEVTKFGFHPTKKK